MHEELTTAAKITPAAAGAVYAHFTLNECVSIATLLYIALQIGLLVPKYWAMMPRIRAWMRAQWRAVTAWVRAKVTGA